MKPEEIKFLYNLMNNKKVRTYFANPNTFSYKEHLRFIKNFKGIFKIMKYKGKKVGAIRLRFFDNEITTAILPEFHGKGIGSKELKEFCKKRNNLKAEINPKNKASIKIYEKAGFKIKHLVMEK